MRNSVLILLGLILILYLIFRTSTVQTWITTKIADKLSGELNTEITVEGVDISWFMHVVLNGVTIYDLHHNKLLSAGRIEAGLKKYSKKQNKLLLSVVNIDDLYLALRTYKGEDNLNMQFIIDHFSSGNTTSSSMTFGVDKVNINCNKFIFSDNNQPPATKGIDYNHLNISDVKINISDFITDTGYFYANIDTMALTDTSGFKLEQLSGKLSLGKDRFYIDDMILQTPATDINSDLRMDYSQWSDWNDFINKVSFNTLLDTSAIDFGDITYFVPELHGMLLNINVSGKVRGPVSNIKLRNLKFSYGNSSSFDGKINLSGLPNIDKSFIDVKVNKFITNISDINSVRLPGGKSIELSENLSKLKNIKVKGRFTGFYNDFVANASIKSAMGDLTTDVLLKPMSDTNAISYNGKIKLDNFNLGGFLNTSRIGKLSLQGEINGKGLDQDANADINISVSHMNFSKYSYKNTKIIGKIANRNIKAEIFSSDSIFKLYAKGSYNFSDSLPKYDFFTDVSNARIGRLMLNDNDTFGIISGRLYVNATGNSVDNITGDIFADSIYYKQLGTWYRNDSIRIVSTLKDSIRDITLTSKYIDGNINGVFKFADLGNIKTYVIKNFIPAFLNGSDTIAENLENHINIAERQHFSFNFKTKNTKELSQIFMTDMRLSKNTRFFGAFDANHNLLDVNLSAPAFYISTKELKGIDIKINSHTDTFYINAFADRLKLSDSLILDSLVFLPVIYRDSIQLRFSFGKQRDSLKHLVLEGGIHLFGPQNITASVNKMDLFFQKKLWQIANSNSLNYKHHKVEVNGFKLASHDNSIEIDGKLSENPDDRMKMKFVDFDVSFFNFYFAKFSTNLHGMITGNVDLGNIYKQPEFLSEFNIKNFIFNGSKLGNADINAVWSGSRNAVEMNIVFENDNKYIPLKFLDLSGFYYPERSGNNLEMTVDLKQFPLEAIQPYLSSFSSLLEGKADGRINLNGRFNEPVLTGKLHTDIRALKVDYLNTVLSLNDELIFTKDYFGYENAKVFDKHYVSGSNNHYGFLTFKLHHKYFSDLSMELDLASHGLEVLNTSRKDNDIFYGYAVADGKVKISGPFDNLNFDINVTPLKDSKISIPMSETAEVESNEFITFVIKDSTLLKNKRKKKTSDDFNMTMDLQFNMTPEATVQLVMDETVGDIITANGKGIIRIDVDKLMNVNMYGSYEITKGDYLFTMRNIINKHFFLKPGGTIVWDGDIMEGRLNMSAVYKTEAKLYDLLQMVDTSNASYKRPTKVDCIINIKGIISSPDISFDIDLPNENNATKELVNMVLYASSGETNQDIMNKNFISLLMLGRFQAPSGYSQSTNPNALASNATELLANQVGTWLNKMSNDVDIGLTWDPGDELTSQEVAVSLSYMAFNDRLLIDGKFGTGGEMKNSESSTRIVGDFSMEYKITKDGRITAKVFNRTNYDDPLTRKAPYTQGAGIVYRKEFDTLKELFEKAKKSETVKEEPEEKEKKKKKKEEEKEGSG